MVFPATGLVAGVAAVAKNQGNGPLTGELIEQLREEGAELFFLDNRLCFRPNTEARYPPTTIGNTFGNPLRGRSSNPSIPDAK
ncbi:hypothetical protein [Pseudomonas sp. GV085]|uniref:hypothetical protein n=1 Tax=Pseudomonas sp. GV085 TaxID=2135756 RepID=UPI0011B25CA9|nr:hypothetical protein [Pseudomonas sp. GV085]